MKYQNQSYIYNSMLYSGLPLLEHANRVTTDKPNTYPYLFCIKLFRYSLIFLCIYMNSENKYYRAGIAIGVYWFELALRVVVIL